LKQERPSFVHIEQLQDLVEETLIELGHAKVALAYAKYRAKRAVNRERETAAAVHTAAQLELATPDQLADIRARISLAKIGLSLTFSDDDRSRINLNSRRKQLARSSLCDPESCAKRANR
jgi:ribonucleoside-diphosphate reductase alpha chain